MPDLVASAPTIANPASSARPGLGLAPDLASLDAWLHIGAFALAAVVASLIAYRLVRPLLRRVTRYSTVAAAVFARADRPLQFLLPLVALNIVWQGVPEMVPGLALVQHASGILTIVGFTWLAGAAVQGVADGVIALHPADVADNLQARRIQTQTRVLARTAMGIVLFAGIAFVLMTFPRARQLGASLLASAGVAGLVAGIAARSVFSNLLAGLQIAMAQPIRIDDVLIVEKEWGRVEEITSTYVVMKLWDERRLIVPLQWFIEHPFENWTRRSSELLGTVMLWVDYGLDVEAVRAEARRLCAASSDWDGRVCTVIVNETNERAMQLRVLISAASSGQAFDLRCHLRERLVAFIAATQPGALPRLRNESGNDVGSAAASPGREHAVEQQGQFRLARQKEARG